MTRKLGSKLHSAVGLLIAMSLMRQLFIHAIHIYWAIIKLQVLCYTMRIKGIKPETALSSGNWPDNANLGHTVTIDSVSWIGRKYFSFPRFLETVASFLIFLIYEVKVTRWESASWRGCFQDSFWFQTSNVRRFQDNNLVLIQHLMFLWWMLFGNKKARCYSLIFALHL